MTNNNFIIIFAVNCVSAFVVWGYIVRDISRNLHDGKVEKTRFSFDLSFIILSFVGLVVFSIYLYTFFGTTSFGCHATLLSPSFSLSPITSSTVANQQEI